MPRPSLPRRPLPGTPLPGTPAPRNLARPFAILCVAVLLGATTLTTAGCTIVKPVVNAVAYAPTQVMERLESTSDRDENDLPTPILLAAFVVLFPLNYAYWTVHGTVGSVFSGVVNDLNLITGNGSFDRTYETMLEPLKTNRDVD